MHKEDTDHSKFKERKYRNRAEQEASPGIKEIRLQRPAERAGESIPTYRVQGATSPSFMTCPLFSTGSFPSVCWYAQGSLI